MRKIERQIVDRLEGRESGTLSPRDKVIGCDYYLHGSLVAIVGPEYVKVSSCGWRTSTTKSRLNAILGHFCNVRINQKDFVWYLGADTFRDGMSFMRVR